MNKEPGSEEKLRDLGFPEDVIQESVAAEKAGLFDVKPRSNEKVTTMTENNGSLQMSVFAHLLTQYQNDAVKLLDGLAQTLELALKDRVKITRGGWPWSKVKPVEKIEVDFDDLKLEISKKSHNALKARQQKIVRGVAIGSGEITIQKCIAEITTRVEEIAKTSEETRDALSKFTMGG